MTASIENDQRLRALRPDGAGPAGAGQPLRLIQGVRVFAIATALIGVGGLAAALGVGEWRVALAGVTMVILAAIASAILVVNELVADRMAFYEHGKADGWYEGWRGMPPSAEHPFTRH